MRNKLLRSQRGVAMMMALITMLVLSILVAQLVYETGVYHRVVFNQVDQLRAELLAKSGLKLALLQIQASKKAADKLKSLTGGGSGNLVDEIWQAPLILPPPAPSSLGEAEKKSLDAFNAELALSGRVSVSISGESDKLNLNQLVWISKAAAASGQTGGKASGGDVVGGASLTPEQQQEALKAVRASFVTLADQLLQNKKFDDDEFRNRYSTLTGEQLIMNLTAWMDPEAKMDGDNRSKEDYYARVEPDPYSIKNAPLYSMTELPMVKGFDDPIAELFENNFTVLSTSGINPNKASAELLRALIPELSKDEAEKVIQRRSDPTQGGPFSSGDDFWNFLNTLGDFKQTKQQLDSKGLKFVTEETAYRVSVSASSGDTQKTWLALVGVLPPTLNQSTQAQAGSQAPFDISKSAEDLAKEKADKDKQKQGNDSSAPPAIIYLKAE